MRMTPTRFGLLLVVAGTLFRLALVLLLRDITEMPTGSKTADDVEFNTIALHVARGEGFTNADDRPTSMRAPGWPLFMAGLYAVCGERPWVIYLASCVLGGLSCLLAYLITSRLTDERSGRIAGWLCVIFLPHAYFPVMFWSENLFTPLFAAVVWLLLPPRGADWKAASWPAVILAGLLLGASALTRPFAVLAGPLLALVLIAYWRGRGLAISCALAALSALIISPWTYRNHLVHHKLVPIAANGGSTFYGGNNDRVVSEWRQFGSWISTTDLPGRDEIDAAPDEISHDAVEWRLGREWVKNNPGKALLTVPLKLARLALWLPEFDGGKRWYYVVRAVGWLPFFAVMLVGVWRGWRRMTGAGWWLIHASILATIITAIIFWGGPRFRDTNAPLLLAYAALAFVRRDARVSVEDESVSLSAPELVENKV